jgi:hypothetical protein
MRRETSAGFFGRSPRCSETCGKKQFSEACMSKTIVRLALIALSAVLSLSSQNSSLAQTQTTGAISGRVTDMTDAIIVNATVIAKSKATGAQSSAATDQNGNYRFSLLPPGAYELRCTAAGFKTELSSNVVVTVTETSVVNTRLDTGQQQETVQVDAQGALLQSNNATLGTTVQGSTIQALPLAGRNYTQVLTLSGGVVGAVNNAAELGRGTIDVYVNGASNISNNFVMDGVDINNFGSGRGGDFVQQGGIPIPSPDAIEEFRIQTTLYDAGFGRDAGANVEVVTRSGTNRLHGAAWEFLRNNIFNANDTFLKQQDKPRPDLKQNQFGGSIGGPILRDKFFFFGSYQGTRQINGLSSSSLASLNLPNLSSNRTAASIGAASCGQSTANGGVQVACDGSNISPVALNLLNLKNADGSYLIPSPGKISTSGSNLAVFSIPGRYTEDQVLANLDYQLTPKHRLSERFFYSRDPQTNPFSSCSPSCPPGFALKTQFTNDVGSLKLTSALTPSFLNEAFVALIRNTGVLNSQASITDASIGLTPSDPDFPLLPIISIQGLFSLGGGFNDFSNSTVNTYEGSDQVSWNRGKHTIRAGFDYERQQFNFHDPGPRRGFLEFLSFPDFLLGASGAQNGSSQSNLFLSEGIAGDISKNFTAYDMSVFAQDDYKVSSRLTLNAGLRWELNSNIGESGGRLSSVIPSLLTPNASLTAAGDFAGWVVPNNFAGSAPTGVTRLGGSSVTNNDLPLHNFGPRVGFAWLPYSDGKTSVRGGYGIYYTRPNGNATLQVLTGPPFVGFSTLVGAGNTAATFENPFNPQPAPGSFPLRTPTSQNAATIIAQNYDSPMTQQYNVDVQQQLSPSTVFDIAYVGTRSTRLLENRNINEALIASPDAPVNGVTTNTIANVSQRVPYLGFSPGGLNRIESYGFSMYNSLQVSIRRQLSRGILVQGSYTWSKALTDVQGLGTNAVFTGGSGDSNDSNDRHQRFGPAAFNRPQRLVVAYYWDLPKLRNANLVTRQVVNGWAVSGVTTIQAGDALTITDSTLGSIFGSVSSTRAQLCPGMSAANIETRGSVTSRLTNYFNTNAFADSQTGCPLPVIGNGLGYGNSSVGSVRGPNQDNTDLTISRNFGVFAPAEQRKIEFRAEFFNAFNHAQYSDPATALGPGSFGTITSSSVAPRLIQFALKYQF